MIQKVMTTPLTMLNSSRTKSVPLSSGGLISEIHRGPTIHSMPMPMPPMNRAVINIAWSTAAVCSRDPQMKITKATMVDHFLRDSVNDPALFQRSDEGTQLDHSGQ